MKNKIGIIGGGNMGSAILNGIQKKFTVSVCEKDASCAKQLKLKFRLTAQDLSSVIKNSDVIILAVKPQDFDSVLGDIWPQLTGQLVISIAAGMTTLYIEKRLKGKARVVRTMPNLPAQIGQGMTAVCRGRRASANDLKLTRQIFESIGSVIEVEERWMDAVTAVSGSGPAYLFLFVECFLKAAGSLGLDPKASQTLVMQTVKGSLSLLENQKEDASSLRRRVTSKGGTTEAALDVFFSRDIQGIFIGALLAARNRANKLSNK